MASSSGNGGDKGKRPLSEVLSSLFCFKPESSTSASTTAPQEPCRLKIDPQSALKQIGEGKYGTVYEGSVKRILSPNEENPSIKAYLFGDSLVGPIEEWTAVAIKLVNQEGMKVVSSLLSEVRSRGNLDSPHFVKLITATEMYLNFNQVYVTMLVYDHMPNGNLKDWLFNKDRCPLTWELREKIALHSAEGLLYLHERMKPQMIYGDFKASSILLDKDFNPHLSFFGLSRTMEVAKSSTDSQPDHLTAESDVYMFGIVLYELLSGWSSEDTSNQEVDVFKLVKAVSKKDDGFLQIMDKRLQNKFPKEAARQLARLADNCLNENPRQRPKMSKVVKILQQVTAQGKGIRAKLMSF